MKNSPKKIENVDDLLIQLQCELLIDQGRKIGDDPVGRSCSGKGAYTILDSVDREVVICDQCVYSLLTPDSNRTFPSNPLGVEGQIKLIEDVLEGLTDGD